MKLITLFAVFIHCSTLWAAPKTTQTNDEYIDLKAKKESRDLKSVISQKSIQNVLETVQLLKQQKETSYRQEKADSINTKSI